jgi:hypothetical protein
MQFSTTPHVRGDRIIEVIQHYDISTNAAPEALFAYHFGIISVYCTPEDNPDPLWKQVRMGHPRSQLSKPAVRVGKGHILHSDQVNDVIGFSIRTDAYKLASASLIPQSFVENRPEDLAWVSVKLQWLWQQCFPGTPPAYILYRTHADDSPYDTHDVLR